MDFVAVFESRSVDHFTRRARQNVARYYRRHPSVEKLPFNRTYQRVCEIERVIRDVGPIITGLADSEFAAFLIAQHYRLLAQHQYLGIRDTYVALRGWCRRWTPNLSEAEVRDIAAAAVGNPCSYDDDQIAACLNVTYAIRTRLRLTTIGAIDVPREDRITIAKNKKKERDRAGSEKRRRRDGQIARKEYLSRMSASAKPWIEAGISERTWRRRRAIQSQT